MPKQREILTARNNRRFSVLFCLFTNPLFGESLFIVCIALFSFPYANNLYWIMIKFFGEAVVARKIESHNSYAFISHEEYLSFICYDMIFHILIHTALHPSICTLLSFL